METKYFQINKKEQKIIAGPFDVNSSYVKNKCHTNKITEEVLQKNDFVPLISQPATGDYRYTGKFTLSVSGDKVEQEIKIYIPNSISRAQCRQWLLKEGLLETVEELIATLPKSSQIDYYDRSTVERTFPLLEELRIALNKTPEDMDRMFLEGKKL